MPVGHSASHVPSLHLSSTARELVVAPFNNCKKFIQRANKHDSLKYHQDSMSEACSFLFRKQKKVATVSSLGSKQKAAMIEKNRCILRCVIEKILLCARQCVALCGDMEKVVGPGNPGNFLAILRVLGNHDDQLREHLESPALKNATMLSAKIQNELLEIMAQHYMVANLVEEIKRARFFCIMADEVTSANNEILSICVRFFNEDDNIREEFLCFTRVPRITGEILANEIKQVLQSKGLELSNLRKQTYDGGANMASCLSGVQGRIKEDAPLATYIHCNSH